MCHVRGRGVPEQYEDVWKKKNFCLFSVCIQEDALPVMYFFVFFCPVLCTKVFLVQGHVNDMTYPQIIFQSTARGI